MISTGPLGVPITVVVNDGVAFEILVGVELARLAEPVSYTHLTLPTTLTV